MLGLDCRTCGAVLDIAPDQRTGKCVYCASPAVIERPPSPDRPNPTFALGFVVTQERALGMARDWVRRSSIFAPTAFRQAEIDDIRGIYVPAYLYCAVAHSNYRASIGENYTVTETYTTTDSQGRTVTRTRTRTETEWRELAGQHASFVCDYVVTASRGLSNAELEAIEPFDMRALHRYGTTLVSGWTAEEPSMLEAHCLELARQETLGGIGHALAGFMPGDSHRDLQYQTRLSEEDLELMLLPVWVLPVRYADDEPMVRLLVNGQTGAVSGKAPISKLKVAIAIVAALVPVLLCLAFVLGAALLEGR